jgi:hypothetical protein
MKDQVVATLRTLTEMLVMKTEQYESVKEDLDNVQDDLSYVREDKERYRLEREGLVQVNQELRDKLNWIYQSSEPKVSTHIAQQHQLLMGLFTNGTGDVVFSMLRHYMNTEADRTAKIKMIKRVREITHWGLKESKDFVESYQFPPTLMAVSE